MLGGGLLAFGDLLLFPRKRLGALELLSPELARNMALLSAAAFSSGVGTLKKLTPFYRI